MGHGDSRRVAGQTIRFDRAVAWADGAGSHSSQFVGNLVQALPANELHDVIRRTLVLADTEHRHNVGVVQPCRRFRLAFESALLAGITV